MEKKTAAGYKVILSACWYLNLLRDEEDWTKVYLTIMTPLYQLSSFIPVTHKTSMALWNRKSWSWVEGQHCGQNLWMVPTCYLGYGKCGRV